MNKALILYLFFFLIPLSFEDEDNNEIEQEIISVALDFIPIVGNLKGLNEAITGIDTVTGKNLTSSERILSIITAIPFGNYLKSGKHLKNGKKFLKAAERAQKLGKMKNALSFAKAAARAMKKANAVGNYIKNAQKFLKLNKFTKFVFKN